VTYHHDAILTISSAFATFCARICLHSGKQQENKVRRTFFHQRARARESEKIYECEEQFRERYERRKDLMAGYAKQI
jgi:hypothetical protein